jgi:hypothetical protein
MLPGPEESYLRSDSQHSSSTGGGGGRYFYTRCFFLCEKDPGYQLLCKQMVVLPPCGSVVICSLCVGTCLVSGVQI